MGRGSECPKCGSRSLIIAKNGSIVYKCKHCSITWTTLFLKRINRQIKEIEDNEKLKEMISLSKSPTDLIKKMKKETL